MHHQAIGYIFGSRSDTGISVVTSIHMTPLLTYGFFLVMDDVKLR